MRSILVVVPLVGCVPVMSESRGVTRGELAGKLDLVFTNASPATMCGLHMSYDDNGQFGDNWLPAGGLPTGKSIAFKVKPGRYKATWNTCKPVGAKAYYAATLTQETAFMVTEATQLFAFVADTVAPTQRAAMLDFHKLVKFSGQPIEPLGARTAIAAISPTPAAPPVAAPEPVVEEPAPVLPKVDLSAFIDQKLVRQLKAKQKGKRVTAKASLKRAHDITTARVGYMERR
jgi:hypothetical protein